MLRLFVCMQYVMMASAHMNQAFLVFMHTHTHTHKVSTHKFARTCARTCSCMLHEMRTQLPVVLVKLSTGRGYSALLIIKRFPFCQAVRRISIARVLVDLPHIHTRTTRGSLLTLPRSMCCFVLLA